MTLTYAYNNQPYNDDGSTPTTWVAGARLSISAPWKGAWASVNYKPVGDNGSLFPMAGVFDLGTLPGPGSYIIEFNDSLPPAGFRGVKFTLVLAAPDVKPEPPVIQKPDKLAERIAGQRLTQSFDGAGATYIHEPPNKTTPAFWLAADHISIEDLTLKSVPRPDPAKANPYQPGIVVSGRGCTIEDVTFADGSGFCIKIGGNDSIVRNLKAGTFTDYLLYYEYAKNLTIDGVTGKGGSTAESWIRFDEATGTVRNVSLDYTTATRKACIRGSFTGTIIDCTFLGGIVGINPLGALDGGQCYCWHKFVGASLLTAVNADECIATVKLLLSQGVRDPLVLCKASLAVAKDAEGKPLVADAAATVARRKSELAKRSDYTATNVIAGYGLRWEANTVAKWVGGEVRADNTGNIFPNVATVYPEPAWLLPGDVPRSFPSMRFVGTKFSGPLSLDDFRKLCKGTGATLDDACTYNGKAVA